MVKRKMSEKQKVAVAANLEKARAAKKPATYKNVAPNVMALDDDHGLSVVSIKGYIKSCKEKISFLKKAVHRGEKGAIAKLASIQAYQRGLNSYLREGLYPYDFYGDDEDKPIQHITIAPAFDEEGFRK